MTWYLVISLLLSSFLAYLIGHQRGFKRGLHLAQETLAVMMCDPRYNKLLVRIAQKEIKIEDLQTEVIKTLKGET
jgi:hypothetical protein